MQDLVITNKGQELMAKLIAGTSTATFTKICTSDFDYSSTDLEELIEMYDIKQTALVSKVSRTDTTLVEVIAAINNSDLKNGYYVRCLGLYAEDCDNNEILYGVSVDNENPDYMPAFGGKTISGISYRLNTKVDNSEQVTLEINPAAIPTIEQFNDLEVSVNSHAKKEIFSKEGIHGLRFYDGNLQVKNKEGHWITPILINNVSPALSKVYTVETDEGGQAELPFTYNDSQAVHVYINGLFAVEGEDYTVESGKIQLNNTMFDSGGDVVTFVVFKAGVVTGGSGGIVEEEEISVSDIEKMVSEIDGLKDETERE